MGGGPRTDRVGERGGPGTDRQSIVDTADPCAQLREMPAIGRPVPVRSRDRWVGLEVAVAADDDVRFRT
jgi:hypothetical protein